MKKLILIILTLILVGVACWWFFGKKEAQPEVSFETTTAQRAKLNKSVTATGTIEAVTKVDVGTQVSGIISRIYVDYNDVVTKGQVIAELDKTNLLSELNIARANLASAKSDLDYNTLNLNRQQTLHDKGLISANEFETARLAYEKSKQTHAYQTESVRKAETNLGYAIITSPIDGVILAKDVEEGQTVAASFSTPTLFTIAQDLTDMRVIAKVDEADIGGVKEGQRAVFTVDAFPDDDFEGRVTQVRQNGETENNVVTYEVVISAPNPELKLKPALTANVTIFTMETDSILSVPTKALRFHPDVAAYPANIIIQDCDAPMKVWTLTENDDKKSTTLSAIAIETGITNGTRTEIVSGIEEGAEIIVSASVESAEPEAMTAEKSPFAPGPRRNNKNDKKK